MKILRPEEVKEFPEISELSPEELREVEPTLHCAKTSHNVLGLFHSSHKYGPCSKRGGASWFPALMSANMKVQSHPR
jgi:hypothetical protein